MATKPLEADIQNKYYFVDHRRLVLDEDFIEREDYDDIDLIIAWIKANGIYNLNPLKCYKRGEQYVIRRGSRRNMAIQKMAAASGEIMMVPIILIKKGDNIERQYFEQATENDGKHYTPWEKAKVLKKARNEYGWSEQKMVKESGWTSVYVKKLLSLADAPEKLIELVRSKKVSGTLAMDALSEDKTLEEKGELPCRVAELIEKGAKGIVVPDLNLFPEEQPAARSNKITRSDLQRPPSYKKITKWISGVDEKGLSAKKLEVLQILRMICEGKFSKEYVDEYFG
jgi:hypothetical protein